MFAAKRFLKKLISAVPDEVRIQMGRWLLPRSVYLVVQGTKPLTRSWWTDRGRPIDRYFIERFLEQNQRYIRGVCLEVQSSDYTRRFGRDLERTDVLDIQRDNPRATIIGDLRRLDTIASSTYDCIVITQVLQYIDDLNAGIAEIGRILRPGGTALVTVPAMQKLDKPGTEDFWRLTPHSTKYLFSKVFPEDCVHVQTWGNVFSGLGSWVGLAQEDMTTAQLDQHDPYYPCIVSARVTKPAVKHDPSAKTIGNHEPPVATIGPGRASPPRAPTSE